VSFLPHSERLRRAVAEACPDKHYGEEMVMGAGGAILVYDVGLPKVQS